MKRITMLLGAGILFLSSMVFAAVPQLINFQGILKDGSGNPVANGSYSVQFTIYDAPVAGNVKWQETQSVNTVNGLFTVLLGNSTPVPDSAFNDSSRYLGVKVGADPEMTPRQKLSSVGYSHRSSEWTSAGQNLFRLNGHVGIGTNTPLTKLHVAAGSGQGVPAINPGLLVNNNAAASDYASLTLIGGSTGGTFLSFGDYTSPFKGNIGFDNSTSAMSFHTNFGVRMTITNNGSVGIGTNTPLTKLHVAAGSGQGVPAINPGLLVNNNAAASDYASLTLIGGSTGGTFLSFGDYTSPFKGNIGFDNSTSAMSFHTNFGVRMTITNNGGVGIGTNSPTQQLDVNGNIALSGTHLVYNSAAGVIDWGPGNSLFFRTLSTQGDIGTFTDRMVIAADGKVGIGTSFPAELLHVNGTAGNNTGVWSNLSDQRLKKEIKPLQNALETVEQLQPVSFRWKDSQKDAQFGRVRGLIAQDVEKVIPEWIKTDPGGYKRIEPIGVDALLIEAIKELKAENDELKNRISQLEKGMPQAEVR